MRTKKIRFLYMALVGIAVAFLIERLMPPPPPSYDRFSGYILAVIISFLIWEGLLRIDHVLNQRLPWIKRPGLRLLVQFLLALVYSSLALFIPMKIYNELVCIIPPDREYLLNRLCLMLGLGVSAILLTFEVSSQFFYNWKSSLVEVERYKTENTRAQLQNLKNQVNPHFLFNNLSVLNALVYKDQDKASEFIDRLSRVYRYLLDSHDKELVNLETEIEFVRSYLYLLQIRFDKNLILHLNIDKETFSKKLPPLAIQALVENVIKHNEISEERPLELKIEARGDELVVSNKLQRRSQVENSTGIGLRNVKERYKYFTDREVEVIEQAGEFKVKLPLLVSA